MHPAIQALMQASPVTGLALAIIENDTITAHVEGEFEGQPLRLDTVWAVASLTKPVFVYGVLQLVQQGLLELDRPLAAYLPQPYPHAAADLTGITARQVMSHTSGLPNWRAADGLRASFKAGAKFSYSSEGLNYLQYVVEHLLGTSMAAYLRQQVFVPLGMTQTELSAETEATLPPRMAFVIETLPANGALSLRTTLGDYARFMLAMLADNPVAAQHPGTAMLTPHIRVGQRASLHWGLGWGLQEHADEWSFWHWGARGIPQAMTFAVGLPAQRKAVVIFTNHAEGLALCRTILHVIFPQYPMPAFDWLLPARNWRADGQQPDDAAL